MKIKPVKTTPAPGYPDKYAGEARQALAASRPLRWIRAPLTVSFLSAAVALGLGGCTGTPIADGTPAPAYPAVTTPGTPGAVEGITLGEPAAAPFDSFIPLFEYGEGSGAIGCMAIAAPVFMSEEEAFAILSAELGDAGMEISWEPYAVEGAVIPVTNLYSMGNGNGSAETKRAALSVDGSLERIGYLPVEFVSAKDVEAWHKDTDVMVSVSSYNIRDAARTLAENNPGLIVFYDPVAAPDIDRLMRMEQEEGESDEDYWQRHDELRSELEQQARAQSEQLLREQARALAGWLSEKGAV